MVPSTNPRQGPEFYSPLQSHTAPLLERGIRATQRWRPPLFQAAPFLSCPPPYTPSWGWELGDLAARPSFLHNLLPIILCIVCGNRASIPGPCTYSYKSASCLSAGPGVSPWARGNGGVFASKRAWPASAAGAAPSSAYSVPNHSHFGSPGPHPGPRGGSTSDILDTGFNIHGLCPPVGRIGILRSFILACRSLPVQALTLS